MIYIYILTLNRFPKTLSLSLNLPSSLKPTQLRKDSPEVKRSGTTATGFHLSISYSEKKSYWYMEQISPWPSLRKECYFSCDCTFTQTGLPLAKLGSLAYEGRCQPRGQLSLSSLLSGAALTTWEKSSRELLVDTVTESVTAQWNTGHYLIFFFFRQTVLKQVSTGDGIRSSTVSY